MSKSVHIRWRKAGRYTAGGQSVLLFDILRMEYCETEIKEMRQFYADAFLA